MENNLKLTMEKITYISVNNTKNLQEENLIEEEEKFHRANFKIFLEYFRKDNNFQGASWNKHRENHHKVQQNKRKIILKEIDQLDSNVIFFKF